MVIVQVLISLRNCYGMCYIDYNALQANEMPKTPSGSRAGLFVPPSPAMASREKVHISAYIY